MVRINIEVLRKELNDLNSHNKVFESLDNASLFDSYSHLGNDDLMQFKSLVYEIMEKQEITRKLQSLNHNISLLKSIVLSKNKDKHHSFMLRVIENNYNSMHSIIDDLGSLKAKADEMGIMHQNLLGSNLPLDAKILLGQKFNGKHEKLNEVYNKQKNILMGLSSIFLKLVKGRVFKRG